MEKNVLIIGIRNEDSLCYYIAKEMKKLGYEIYATYHDKSVLSDVKRVADEIGIKKIYRYDARKDKDLQSFTSDIKKDNIILDVIIHGIAYSSDPGAQLNYFLKDISWEEFTDAIRVGAFSLVEVVGNLIENISEHGSILALTSRMSTHAIPGYNVIGAAKATLNSIIRGLADSLGNLKKIRVNGVAPGPVATKSLSRIGNVLDILEEAKKKSPLKRNVIKEDVGKLVVSIAENKSITGVIYPIDTGMDVMG